MIKNLGYCEYTYLHRRALAYYIKKNDYLDNEEKKLLLKRAEIHDMDKMTLYLFRDKEKASKYHREHSSHHIKTNVLYTHDDLLESIFDYECAALTKQDKPLNAYDTVIKYYSEFTESYMPELRRLHMDHSYLAIEEKDKEYIRSIKVTENDILNEISVYLNNNPENIYTELGDNLCSKEEFLALINYKK